MLGTPGSQLPYGRAAKLTTAVTETRSLCVLVLSEVPFIEPAAKHPLLPDAAVQGSCPYPTLLTPWFALLLLYLSLHKSWHIQRLSAADTELTLCVRVVDKRIASGLSALYSSLCTCQACWETPLISFK